MAQNKQYFKYLRQLEDEQQRAITINAKAVHLVQSKMKRLDILEMRALRRPPHPMQIIMYTLFNVLDSQVLNWYDMRDALRNPANLMFRLSHFENGNINRANMRKIEIDFIQNELFSNQSVGICFHGSRAFYDWIHPQYKMGKHKHKIEGAKLVFGYLRKYIEQNIPFGIQKLVHLYYESAAISLESDVSSLPVLLPEADNITSRHSEPAQSEESENMNEAPRDTFPKKKRTKMMTRESFEKKRKKNKGKKKK